jgi:hypothetical protein
MNKLKNLRLPFFLLLSMGCLFYPMVLHAQIGPPPEENIPIDGGASLLAAAGVAYGVKKYRDYRKGPAEEADEIE